MTIVAPKTRIDLALPDDVPFVDLLPTVLSYAGHDLADDPAAANGWMLLRAGNAPLDPDRSPAQAEVRDGELLYLRPRGAEFPEPVFDDVVDAVASATQERTGRWRPATTRGFGLAVGIATLLAGAAMVLFSGPPHLPSALVGLGVGALMVATAAVVSRAFGDSRTGSVIGLVALGYLGVGGLLLFAGDRTYTNFTAPQVLLAGTAMLLGTAVAMAGAADLTAVFLGALVASTGLCAAALICIVSGASAQAAAAGVAVGSLAMMPLLPMLSFRLAGLPVPSIPSGPDDLRADAETVDGARALALSERADQILGGLLGAVAVLVGAAATVTALSATLPGELFAATLGVFMLARARWFISRRQRLPLLLSGAVTLAVVAFRSFFGASQPVRLAVGVVGALVVACTTITFALTSGDRRRSPVWGRLLDMIEIVLVLAVIPLGVWVSGLYDWVRTIADL